MKVLYITNMFPSKEYPVDGIFVKEQIEDTSRVLNLEAEVCVINAKRKGRINYLYSLFSIPYKLIRNHYDIVHIHYGLSALFLLFFKPRAKVCLTLHGGDILKRPGNSWQIFLTKMILPKVDKVFIQNAEMEAIVRPINPSYEVVPCGINIDFFKPLNVFRKLSDPRLVLFPNSPLREVKDFPLFEEVIRLLIQKGLNVTFRCIDQLSRTQVRDLMNSADCLLMTSISEGSPQVIKEALSCGLPVVSVPVGDVRILMEGVPGCYVSETRSPEELCQLTRLSFDHDREAVRKAFIQKRSYDHVSVSQRISENYAAVLENQVVHSVKI